jgi:hypothetical protein
MLTVKNKEVCVHLALLETVNNFIFSARTLGTIGSLFSSIFASFMPTFLVDTNYRPRFFAQRFLSFNKMPNLTVSASLMMGCKIRKFLATKKKGKNRQINK